MDTPKLRFKGFNDEWQAKPLSSCLTISNLRNQGQSFGRDDVLSVSDEYGVVNQISLLGRSYAGEDISNYKVTLPGQLIYTKSPLKAKPYGIIKANHNQGIVSVLYAVYDVAELHSSSFLDYYFAPGYRTNKYLLPLVRKGAKNTLNISDSEFLLGKVVFPDDTKEQLAITDYFDKISDILRCTEKEIESLRQVRTAAMDSMFPQKGESAPRVRFKGFYELWTSSKLGELSEKVLDKNSKLDFQTTFTNSAELGIIDQLDFFDHNISKNANIGHYTIVREDDFVYNPRISVTAPVGPINRNKLGYVGVVSPLYYVFRVQGIDKDFLEVYFKTALWHKYLKDNGNTGARHDRISITDDLFRQMPISHPQSLAEQQRIAEFFRNLDRQIEIQSRILEQLKRVKAACLDQMFV